MTGNQARPGVRLIDLIAVVLIVLGVAAVLRPVFISAHDQASHDCSTHMRELGLGFIQYVQDYDEKWPGGAQHWAGVLWPYEKDTNTYRCPNDSVHFDTGDRVSYAMNSNLPANSIAALSAPSLTVLDVEYDGTPALLDWNRDHVSRSTNGNGANSAWGNGVLGRVDPTGTSRHDTCIIAGATDGHVKLLAPMRISSGRDSAAQTSQSTVGAAAGTSASDQTKYTLTFSEK